MMQQPRLVPGVRAALGICLVASRRAAGRSWPGTLGGVATKLRLEPDLAATVERARQRAAEFGELRPADGSLLQLQIPPEVGAVIGQLLRDGTYAEAVARVVADDPDLADQ